MKIMRVGVDLAKNVFQVHAVDQYDKPVWRQSLKRHQWLAELERRVSPDAQIGMEACAGSHHWARALQQRGYRVNELADRGRGGRGRAGPGRARADRRSPPSDLGAAPRSGRRAPAPRSGRGSRAPWWCAVSARMRATSRRSSPRSDASSELNGSSRSTTLGLDGEGAGQRHALLLATGELMRDSGGPARPRPTRSSELIDPGAFAPRAGRSRCCRRPSGAGTARPPAGRSRRPRCWGGTERPPSSTTRPSIAIVPASTCSNPAMSRSSVVLPLPDAPSTAVSRAVGNARDRRRRAPGWRRSAWRRPGARSRSWPGSTRWRSRSNHSPSSAPGIMASATITSA